jgi:mannonate dehydratase
MKRYATMPGSAASVSAACRGCRSPERDKDIDDIHKMIEACAIAGVHAFKYNMSLLGVLRTGEAPGRGGSVYGQFRAADLPRNEPPTRTGVVDADAFW